MPNLPVLILVFLVAAILGYGCASGAKGLGRKRAVTRYTNTASVNATIEGQVTLLAKAGSAAIFLLIAAAALVVFTPSTGGSWAPLVAKVVGFAANIALGFAAGVGANIVAILAIPARRDSIDCQIDMKRRTGRRLERFLIALLLCLTLVLSGMGLAVADDGVWPVLLDATASVDQGQREAAIRELIAVAAERAHRLKARAIQIIRFDEAVMMSDMVWVPVPAEPVFVDCNTVEPVQTIEEGFILLSPGLASARKQTAVEECLTRQNSQRAAYAGDLRAFEAQLRLATKVTPRSDVTTRIVPLLKWVVQKPSTLAVDVITDGIDHSGISLDSLKIPRGMEVRLVLTRPDLKRARPTLDDVLTAARAWSCVPGITVMSVGEYGGTMASLKDLRP